MRGATASGTSAGSRNRADRSRVHAGVVAAIPAVPARTRWHPVIAGSAAPAYVAALAS